MGPLCLNLSHFGTLLWRRDTCPVPPRPILAYHHGRHAWDHFPWCSPLCPSCPAMCLRRIFPIFLRDIWRPRFLPTTNKELPQWSTPLVCPRCVVQIGFVVGAGVGAPAPVPRIETHFVSLLFPFPSCHGEVGHKHVWCCATPLWHHSGLQQCKCSFVTGDLGRRRPIHRWTIFRFQVCGL